MTLSLTKDLLLIVGMLIGGGWSLWLYFKLKPALSKKLERDKLELEKRELELKILRQPSPCFNMTLKKQLTEGNHYLVFCDIEIINNGNLNFTIFLTRYPLYIYKMKLMDDGYHIQEEASKQKYSEKDLTIDTMVVRPSSKDELSFVSKIQDGGTYMFEFSAEMAETDKYNFEKSTGRKLDGVYTHARWVVKKYIHLD